MNKETENLLLAALGFISEELDRIMWNKNQEEYNSPFQNYGNVEGYKNDTFEVHAYDWSDEPKYDFNFKYKNIEISWYKYYTRGLFTEADLTPEIISKMLTDCIESLRRDEKPLF